MRVGCKYYARTKLGGGGGLWQVIFFHCGYFGNRCIIFPLMAGKTTIIHQKTHPLNIVL